MNSSISPTLPGRAQPTHVIDLMGKAFFSDRRISDSVIDLASSESDTSVSVVMFCGLRAV